MKAPQMNSIGWCRLAVALLVGVALADAPTYASSPPYRGPWLDGAIELEVSSAIVPSTVRIVGPQHLVDALKRAAQIGGDKCNFPPYALERASVVNWGDDGTFTSRESQEPFGRQGTPCGDPTVKVYRVPGRYNIESASWLQPLPWRGSATIDLNGAPPPLDFELTSPTSGQVLEYGHTSLAMWSIAPDLPLDLTFTLLDHERVAIATRRIAGIRYSGEGVSWFNPQTPDEKRRYEQLLLNGQNQFSLQASLMRSGKTLLTREVSGLVGGREITYQHFDLLRPWNSPPNTAAIRIRPFHSLCFSASIDWGDGKPPTTFEQPIRSACPLASSPFAFTHTYDQPGVYVIRVRLNDDPFRPLAEQAGYIERRIDVRDDNRHLDVGGRKDNDVCHAKANRGFLGREEMDLGHAPTESPLTVHLMSRPPAHPNATYHTEQ
jgi:hypothetical protein